MASFEKLYQTENVRWKSDENEFKAITVLSRSVFHGYFRGVLWGHPYVHKIFRKTNISYPLIHTPTCAYQGVRNNNFSENFAYVLNQ